MSKAFHSIVVFADGACRGNPGPGGWGVVIATPKGQVLELGGASAETTNNKMELTAVGRALRHLEGTPGAIEVYTDSTYVIQGITKWIWGWRKREWKTAEGKDVANVDYWKRLSAILGARREKFPEDAVLWKYVRGHSGIPGNERVDAIAVAFSRGESIRLYDGPLLSYDVPIHDLPENTEVPEKKQGVKERVAGEQSRVAKQKKTAYSYVSLVAGVPWRHETWDECNRRVNGVPGAKFKKCADVDEESKTLKSWGVELKEKEK